ncbi:MAG: hypothetical protein Tsb0027_12610 [Wenzhouxiangellaceae bacterium]
MIKHLNVTPIQFTTMVFMLATSMTMPLLASAQTPETGQSVRHDTSRPMRDIIAELGDLNPDPTGEVFEIPNILKLPPTAIDDKLQAAGDVQRGPVRGDSGLPSPMVEQSFDGYTAADNVSLFGGTSLPPDTNGDVGPNEFIQYVNTGWLVLDKTGTRLAGPFPGNTFWAGFGGPCETNNAGDPIVLYDKIADRWLFSQFTSSNNPDGRQCFAISTTSDPLGPYNRYEFLFPGVFNDYPHIGIWTDTSGERSGYYLTTHDFIITPQQFLQNSYSVVERDAMLAGGAADFVRFTDTAFLGTSAFGALPSHLESAQPARAGKCNAFVLARPDLQAYQVNELCVNWDSPVDSILKGPVLVDAGESWQPGPGSVIQPGGTAGNALDTLASSGRVLSRVSYRAFPADSGRDDIMAINIPVDVGGGQAGFRWAEIRFPSTDTVFDGGFEEGELSLPGQSGTVANQGEFAPDTTVDRWMPAISVDRDGNLGAIYTASSDVDNIFPSARITTRKFDDPANTLRSEEVCVDGGGIQQSASGRWGDYSSVSVDPVDECTFWATVEYMPATSNAGWANRVCSFSFADCGSPRLAFSGAVDDTLQICSADSGQIGADFQLLGINGFSDPANLSVSGLPGGASATFNTGSTINAYPAVGRLSITGLDGAATAESSFTLSAVAGASNTSRDYQLSISANATVDPALLSAPGNAATEVDLRPQFSWQPVTGATSYRIEVAVDAGFNSIVLEAVTADTVFTAENALDTATEHFWRVTALNNCGAGVVSAVNSFTTGDFTSGTAAACPAGTSPNVVFFDDIEAGTNGWTLPAAPIGSNTWAQTDARAFSGMSWFAQDLAVSTDQYLVSPSIVLPSAAQQPISLAFWNFQNMEANDGQDADACWDGGLLEISTDGGASFTQIATAQLLRDPYNGLITNNPDSPISDLNAWCADDIVPASGEQTDIVVADLNAFAGQTVQFRFRLGTDSAVGDEGWYIDNVTVQGCQ